MVGKSCGGHTNFFCGIVNFAVAFEQCPDEDASGQLRRGLFARPRFGLTGFGLQQANLCGLGDAGWTLL